eukprot:277103-Pyramimonas_sp.AAC.1
MAAASAGAQMMYISFKYAMISAPAGNLARSCLKAGSNAKQNNAGMRPSPCSPPPPWVIVRMAPRLFRHLN